MSMWFQQGKDRLLVGNSDWITDSSGAFARRQDRGEKPWFVMRALDDMELETFRTHAEAIKYAQTEARLTCMACGRRMPYLESCIEFKPFCHPDVGRDCYTETTQRLTLERYSIPQKIVIGEQP